MIFPNKLPSEYQEVEYIQTSGGQYINTTIKGASKWLITAEYTNPSNSTQILIGTSIQAKNWFGQSSNVYSCGVDTTISSSTKANIELDFGTNLTAKVNNETVTRTDGTFNTSNNFKLFGFTLSYSKAKIYKIQCIQNNAVVLSMIPCYRVSDDEIGMYDLVNDTFYPNEGSGNFTKGNDIPSIREIIINNKSVKKITDTNNNVWWKKPTRLPAEYQEVEYIENTGQSYINTGFTLNQNSKVEMVVYSTNFAQGHLFGSRESATSKNFTISDGHLDFGTYTKNRISFNTYADNLKTTLTFDKNNLSVVNETYNQNFTLSAVSDFTCIAPAYIFYVSGNPYGNYRVWGKLYSCKIWDNGTLARDLVPCYRNSDREPGVYDLVNDIFYTNAGTGRFLIGNDDNLFDPTTATVLQAYFENGTPNITSNAGNRVTYIACKPNTTYEIKKLLGRIFWVGCTVNEPDIGVATTSRQQGTTGAYDGTTMTSMTYTTDSTANYLAIRYTSIWTDGSANESAIFNSIEVYEQ